MARRISSPGNSGSTNADGGDRIDYVPLSQETRRRYLNYAMSVITSRALPDVRDGLKPVQRRILFSMYEDRLLADAKPRKCAKIVGDTMGAFHPHGDSAIYDTLVRMAQDFTFRYPLVDGQGNFGSIMGLPAAAYRYTEAKLTAFSEQLLQELRMETVDYRPTYDGSRTEPTVLPTRVPHLLVNGTTGIAVGMATNMPPHNLGEVVAACVHLINNDGVETKDLLKFIKGPDFPLGGRIITDRKELRGIYEEGRGAIKVRGEWKPDRDRKGTAEDRLVIYSIPYTVESGPLVQEIGAVVANRKLPQLLNVADETDDKHGLRIVLELKPGSDPEVVMAYLFKHTSLELNFNYNATSLVPSDSGQLVPARLNLVEMLQHFLTFRLATVRRRFEFQLRQLERRIHILEGFAIIFNDLDKALKIIRNSTGKRDAADKLMKAFPLDEEQTMAILELQLYRISQLEINTILEELAEKRKEADKIRKILASEKKLWGVVQTELEEVAAQFGDKRRTSLGSSEEVAEFDASAYIVRENTNVVLTRDGWVKRVGRLQSVETTRVREGDAVLDVLPGSTVDSVVFFASDGVAYTLGIDQIPVSSGYGEPLSKHVKLADGVSIIAAVSTDPRFTPEDGEASGEAPATPYLSIVTAQGQTTQIPLGPYRTASTKSGRKFCRLGDGDRVVGIELVREATSVFLATRMGRVIHYLLEEVPVLSGAGRGVRGIKLDAQDEVLGQQLVTRPSDCLRIKTDGDKVLVCGQQKYAPVSRGGKGDRAVTRSAVTEIVRDPIPLVDWAAIEAQKE
ncbi:DNA topoisomerase IV subunit A [Planctellipticum variicoloris]|uniref:DNA topoisomerase IV subunit A n=1 Tax=Planctellipticum variicoloris TaxID=3064265 RepID=UPI0030135758|nr:DNA topoisomerase IV subunit A [Planctomycetaceae bacterium SH412]